MMRLCALPEPVLRSIFISHRDHRVSESSKTKNAIKLTRLSNDKKRQFAPFRVRRLTSVVDVDSTIILPYY